MIYSPIWKDNILETTSTTLNYRIRDLEAVRFIENNYTKAMPGQTGVTLCINNKVDDRLNPDFATSFVPATNNVISNPDAVRTYRVLNPAENDLGTYKFLYDWSYEDNWSGQTRHYMTESVNTHIDPRMKLMKTIYNTAQTSIEWTRTYKPEISVSPTIFSFPGTGGSLSFQVTSNVPWQIIDAPDWMVFNKETGGTNSLTSRTESVTLKAVENVYMTGRTGTFTVYGDGVRVTANVSQEASEIEPENRYLTFVVRKGGYMYLYLRKSAFSSETVSISYSKNGGNWTSIHSVTADTYTQRIDVSKGDVVRLKGYNRYYSNEDSSTGYYYENRFVGTAEFDLCGNIMSLIKLDDFIGYKGTLVPYKYTFYELFSGCGVIDASNLVLPATGLSIQCYAKMFSGCTKLTAAPELPAPSVNNGCYRQMFSGCISLKKAPDLLVRNLVSECYLGMFQGCKSLTYLKCMAIELGTVCPCQPSCITDTTKGWLSGASTAGTFVRENNVVWSRDTDGIPSTWDIDDDSRRYLTLKIKSNGNLRWMHSDNNHPKTIYYSVDNGKHWIPLESKLGEEGSSVGGKLIPVHNGDNILLKGYNESYGGDGYYASFERTSVSFELEGNIMSLVYGDNFVDRNFNGGTLNFRNFFSLNTGLTSTRRLTLPDTTTYGCYAWMFQGCSSMQYAPYVLPSGNFSASTRCYEKMYKGCTSLTAAPMLPAYHLAERCYYSMFENCTTITRAPVLKAGAVFGQCYVRMFYGCSSLRWIYCMALVGLDDDTNTKDWVYNVGSGGWFYPYLSASWMRGDSGIPYGWSVDEIHK